MAERHLIAALMPHVDIERSDIESGDTLARVTLTGTVHIRKIADIEDKAVSIADITRRIAALSQAELDILSRHLLAKYLVV